MLLGDNWKPCVNLDRGRFGRSSTGFAMLDTLLIAGLVTAVATPVIVLIIEVLERIGAAVTILRAPAESPTLPETLPMSDEPRKVSSGLPADKFAGDEIDADAKASEIAVVHEIPVDVSDYVILAFQPGTDSCRVWLRGADIEFFVRTIAAGTVLEFHDVEERLTITFQGLNRLPLKDIEIVFECPDKGRQVQPLTDFGGRDLAETSGEDSADAEWRLAAWAERERAVEAFDDPMHVPANRECGPLLPNFAGFDAEAECIEIWVAGISECDLQVEVVPTQDGQHGLVLIAGRPTALLQGAADASARNVRLVPMTAKAA